MFRSLANLALHCCDERLAKVRFPSPDAPRVSETLWTVSLGGSRYRVLSVPVLTQVVNVGDIVSAEAGEGGLPIFSAVLERGGHRTAWLALLPGADGQACQDRLALLREEGCACESAYRGLYAVDIPPEADGDAIAVLLEGGCVEGIWTYQTAVGST